MRRAPWSSLEVDKSSRLLESGQSGRRRDGHRALGLWRRG